MAAAGVGAGVGAWAGDKISGLDLGKMGTSLAANMDGGLANAATRTRVNGSHFGDNLMAALPDILGNIARATIWVELLANVTDDRCREGAARSAAAVLRDHSIQGASSAAR